MIYPRILVLVEVLTLVVFGRAADSSAASTVEVQIFKTPAVNDDYLTWSPAPARIRLMPAATADVAVVMTNDDPAANPDGGDVVFSTLPLPAGQTATKETLALTLPANGDWVEFAIAGKFQKPSTADKDAVLVVHAGTADGAELGRQSMMVRVRKNALTLTSDERDRYLKAVRALRDQSKYKTYQEIHSANAMLGNPDAHRGPAFVAWHRVFILRFERELQAIDRSVSLPYWKFDEPAPELFSDDFMGSNDVSGSLQPEDEPAVDVTFAVTNSLHGWTTDLLPFGQTPPSGSQKLQRAPADRTLTANLQGATIRSESGAVGPQSYPSFTTLENNPHGFAHVWGGGNGPLGSVPIAVQDPLFFLLHCNVDRLWAKWQRRKAINVPVNGSRWGSGKNGYEPQTPKTFPPMGASIHIGHYLQDTMWPWNGVSGGGTSALKDRPTGVPPGGAFPILTPFSPLTGTPGPNNTLDYLGRLDVQSCMGFAYDDDSFAPDP